ncbi:MAG: hypothetical protein ACRYHQ_35780 [Janthinobacterium lividum]
MADAPPKVVVLTGRFILTFPDEKGQIVTVEIEASGAQQETVDVPAFPAGFSAVPAEFNVSLSGGRLLRVEPVLPDEKPLRARGGPGRPQTKRERRDALKRQR